MTATQQTGAEAIAAERQRQIDEEGYTAETEPRARTTPQPIISDQEGPTHGQPTDPEHPQLRGADMNDHAITAFAAAYLVTVLCLTAVALVWLALRPDNWLDQSDPADTTPTPTGGTP